MEASKILIRPVLSEKASRMKEQKKFVFQVAMDSNKIEIAKAVEEVYKVEVDKVTTLIMKPKHKRVRSRNYGFTDFWKKAVVHLKKGDIDFYK